VPHWKAAVVSLGLLATLAACEVLGPPSPLPDNAQALATPPEYRDWWTATEQCSGRQGRFDAIRWYVVPGAKTLSTSNGPKVGWWSHSRDGNRIILAGEFVKSELVVRHEMLHVLLDRGGHPSEYFQSACQLTWDTWGHGG